MTRVGATLAKPQSVIQSARDDEARLYYGFYTGTKIGDKFLCVVVKVLPDDAFVVTACRTHGKRRHKSRTREPGARSGGAGVGVVTERKISAHALDQAARRGVDEATMTRVAERPEQVV